MLHYSQYVIMNTDIFSWKYNRFLMAFVLITMVTIHNSHCFGQLSASRIFSDHMILQRGKTLKIWGWSIPGDEVHVRFEKQSKKTITDSTGSWHVYLDPLVENDRPQVLDIMGQRNHITIKDVLIGDLWLLGGQSNMEMDLDRIYHGDMEVASANFNKIRLMTIPKNTGVSPSTNFISINEYDDWLGRFDQKGDWFVCSPATVQTFSGIGYIFGRRLHMASGVPIGLIDASLGGTTIEAWLSPKALQQHPENKALLAIWKRKADEFNPEVNLAKKIDNWQIRSKERMAQGLEPLPKPVKPDEPPNLNRNYPGASYNGMINPLTGLSIKGIIFHQGYNNALSNDARPALYAKNMCALIDAWRNTFHDDALPFGIIELSAGGSPQSLDNLEIQMTDAAPFIREAQFKAYRQMKQVGFAGAYDQQEDWFHPRKKMEPAERMARWALDQYYQIPLGWKPVNFLHKEIKSDTILLHFDREIKTHDDRDFEGFTISGEQGHFFPASATYLNIKSSRSNIDSVNKRVLVIHSRYVQAPVHVRYAWARNPLGNVVSASIRERVIPLPSFRTDKWDYPEAPVEEADLINYRKVFANFKNRAQVQSMERKKMNTVITDTSTSKK